VSQYLQDVKLSSYSLHVRVVLDLVLLKNFNRDWFSSMNVGSLFDLAEGSLAQSLA